MEFGASPQRSQDKTAKLESSHEDSPGDDSDDDVFDSVPYMFTDARWHLIQTISFEFKWNSFEFNGIQWNSTTAGETADRTLQSFALDARLTRMAEYAIGIASILVDGRPSRRARTRAIAAWMAGMVADATQNCDCLEFSAGGDSSSYVDHSLTNAAMPTSGGQFYTTTLGTVDPSIGGAQT